MRRVTAATVAAWAALAALVAWRFAGKATDDIYVTYRYAWNLAHGLGFTFNPGERVFGLTDPGVGLLLALAHRLTGLPIPLLGTALSALALWGIAVLLLLESSPCGYAAPEEEGKPPYRHPEASLGEHEGSGRGKPSAGPELPPSQVLRSPRLPQDDFVEVGCLVGSRLFQSSARRNRLPEGIAAGTLLLTSGYLWTAQGSGPLFALLSLLAAARLAGRSDLAAGLLAGLAFWFRPDAALGVALLGLLLLWERRRLPWAWASASLAVMLAGCAAAWAAFGTLLPNTLAAKRAYAAFEPGERMGVAFWRAAWEYWRGFEGPGAAVLLVLGLLGLAVLLVRGGRASRLLALSGLALAAAYTLLRVPFFLWYTVPAAAALLVGAPWAVGEASRALAAREKKLRPLAAAVAVLGGLALATALWGTARWFADGAAGDWRLAAYARAGLWLRDHSAPGDSVALEEIGILGYTSQRPVSDLMGLVTPRAVPYAAQGDLIGAFLAQPTDFLVFHTFTWRGGTRPIVTRPWFTRAYAEAVRFDFPARSGSISVYHRLPQAKIPPPRPPREHRPEPPPLPPG